MTKQWQEETGSFRVRNSDDEVFKLYVISTFRENEDMYEARVERNALKELRDEFGRHANPVEGQDMQFVFDDAPNEILTVVDAEELKQAMA